MRLEYRHCPANHSCAILLANNPFGPPMGRQALKEGDILAATPQGQDGFLVLKVQPPHLLILGGCWDADWHHTLAPNTEPLPANYWRSTWTFVLEPQTPHLTRLIVRARGDFRAESRLALRLRALMIRPIHNFMQQKQLKNLKQRAEMTQHTSAPLA